MNSLPLLFLMLGMFFILVGYYKYNKTCPPPKIEYRYIPRTFYNEQMSPGNVQQNFHDMFKRSSTWTNYPVGAAAANSDNSNSVLSKAFYNKENM